MTRTNTKNYDHFDKYVLRTPYLSFNEVQDLTIDRVRELCSSQTVAEAIFLASPELHQEMLKYLKKQHEKTDEKLLFALLKYLLRMGTRSTPFGLFGGCSLGIIGNKTVINLNEPKDYKRVTRLDMNFLCALSQKLEAEIEIRNELIYYPNTSLYRIGNEFRYVEYQYIGTERTHFLMSIDTNELINEIITKSEEGITIEDLAIFISNNEITMDTAIDFVHELIDNQILISSISPSLTGEDYFEILRNGIENKVITKKLNQIKCYLFKLDNNKENDNINVYKELKKLAVSFDVDVNNKFLFQSDLNITCKKNQLDQQIIEDVKIGLNLLNKMSSKKENKRINQFKKRFYERFEEEEVPLTLVLDVETGIGYGEEYEDSDSYSVSELIDDLPIMHSNSYKNGNPTTTISQTKLDRLLLRKLLSCFRNNEDIIELNDEDFNDFEENWDKVPNTFCSKIKIIEVENSKPIIEMSSFGGSTGTFLLSRFSHLNKDIYSYIEEILIKEENENVIFAEIVHLPEARVGNVLSRANLRKYEIPYLAKSLLPKDRQLLITDLMVSMKGDRIVLRSKAHNKEVHPILSNAHNFEGDSLPIYSFLSEIQTQDFIEYFGFKWGDTLVNQHYLPRVIYRNIVLSLATWKIDKSEYKNIQGITELKIWLGSKSIPRRVRLSDLDNTLLFDFENELSCKLFLSMMKKRKYLILEEYLFNENKALITNHKGVMEHEIILSFYKDNS